MSLAASAWEPVLEGSQVVFRCPAAGEFRLQCQTADVTVSRTDGGVAFKVSSFRNGGNQALLSMLVPPSFIQGGQWRVDQREGAFPFALGLSEKLFQGNAREIAVKDVNGETLALEFPVGTFMEVQDNRKWNWNTFEYRILLPGSMKEWTTTVKFTPAASRVKLLDRFGQTARDFPGKIADEAELKADLKQEQAFYSALAFPARLAKKGLALDRFGGVLLPKGRAPKLRKTGFFHVEKRAKDGRWFLVDPDGNPFFHLGICVFGLGDDLTDVTGREESFEWIPPHAGPYANVWKTDEPYWSTRAVSHYRANLVRKFGSFDPVATARRNIRRVRQAGFNSMGAFGDVPEAARKASFPYVKSFPFWGLKQIPSIRGLFDPYDPETVREVRGRIAMAKESADDPLLIGWFIDNEQAFESIARELPKLDDSWACKRAFTASGKSADAFAADFLETYYGLVETAFREADPNHLLLGSRWMPSTADNEALCRIAAKHLDVVSVNYYAHAIDPAFLRRLSDWTGRPLILSEFFYSAGRESTVGPFTYDLPTQKARGEAYGRYVAAAVAAKSVVGVEWFGLVDQAATGRYFQGVGGESYNTGLLSVTDRPYRPLWEEMLKANLSVHSEFTR